MFVMEIETKGAKMAMKSAVENIRIDADTEEWGRVVDTGYIISRSKMYVLVHADKLRADILIHPDEMTVIGI